MCLSFSPYFDHDAFMHHTMHVLEAPLHNTGLRVSSSEVFIRLYTNMSIYEKSPLLESVIISYLCTLYVHLRPTTSIPKSECLSVVAAPSALRIDAYGPMLFEDTLIALTNKPLI